MRCRPAIVLLENNHILLMKYQYGASFIHNFPGGNPDSGELFPETIVRECQEELGIDVEVGPMLLLGEVPESGKRETALHILFAGNIVGGIPRLQPQETTAQDLVWVPIADLPALHLYPNVGVELQDLLFTQAQGRYLGEIHQPWVD